VVLLAPESYLMGSVEKEWYHLLQKNGFGKIRAKIPYCVYPQMGGFGSGIGRNEGGTAGVARLR
jgi:hypothetical protein